MQQYLDIATDILANGAEKKDRTGIGTLSVFGRTMRFDLQKGFPILTTKKVFFKGAVAELLWFLSGSTNISDLPDYIKSWWEPWADSDGYVGPIYGKQYRSSDGYGSLFGVDQFSQVVKSLREDPDSRRHIIVLWHPYDMSTIQKPHLPCCHGTVIQFYVANGKLSCRTTQRSADVPIGLPINIVSYALLTHIVAQLTGYEVGELIYDTNDTHIYLNQIKGIKEQLARTPLALPKLVIKRQVERGWDFKVEDFALEGYEHYPAIQFPKAAV